MCVVNLKMYSRIHWNVIYLGFNYQRKGKNFLKNFQFPRGLVPWKKIQASAGRFPTSPSRLSDLIPTTWEMNFCDKLNSILLKLILKDFKFILKNQKYLLNQRFWNLFHQFTSFTAGSLYNAMQSTDGSFSFFLFQTRVKKLLLPSTVTCPQQLYICCKLWGIHSLDRLTALQKFHTDTGFISLTNNRVSPRARRS